MKDFEKFLNRRTYMQPQTKPVTTGNILKNLNIHNKLILSYIFLITLPLVLVGLFSYNMAASFIRSEVSGYVSEVLEQVNDNVDYSLGELERIGLIISSDFEVQRILQKDKNRPTTEFVLDDEIMNRKINEVTKLRGNIEGLFIFSYNGEVYQYKGADNSIDPNYIFTRARWFNMMKNLDQKTILLPTYLSDEVIGPGYPKKVFSYIQQISHIETGKPIGYIVIHMDPQIFKTILDKLNVREYQEFIFLDSNKTILYHTKEENISTQFRSSYISNLLQTKTGNIFTNVNNKPMLITFNTSLLTNWTVVSSIPIDKIYTKITNLQYFIVTMVIFFTLLASFIGILISRNITKPLDNLRKLMKKAEVGEFDGSIPIRSRDEIGELSFSFNNMLSKIKELIQKVYKTEILKKEAELNALQAQINPHFLYNTLQIMDIVAEEEGVEVISTICQSLSKIFRYSINRGKEIVPLSKELEHVQNYIHIQKIRFNNKFEVFYDIDVELYNYRIIKLILQPLVENALFHGIEKKKGKCTIIISGKRVDGKLILMVEDDGAGMDEEQLRLLKDSLSEEIVHAEINEFTQRSIGIKNVHARIQLYFGSEYGVRIESILDKGTKIQVSIPPIPYLNNEEDSNVENSNC